MPLNLIWVDLAFSCTKGYPGQVKWHSLPFQVETALKYQVVPLTFAHDRLVYEYIVKVTYHRGSVDQLVQLGVAELEADNVEKAVLLGVVKVLLPLLHRHLHVLLRPHVHHVQHPTGAWRCPRPGGQKCKWRRNSKLEGYIRGKSVYVVQLRRTVLHRLCDVRATRVCIYMANKEHKLTEPR